MQYRLLNGKEVIDLTGEEEETSPTPTDSPPQAWPSNKACPLPSVSTSPADNPQRDTMPQKLSPPAKTQSPSAGIHPEAKTIVGLALLVDGRNGLDRARLCKETGLSRQQLTDLVKEKGSVWRGMVAAAQSLG